MSLPDPDLLTVGEVAQRLGISIQLVGQLWREGIIAAPVDGPREDWAYWRVEDIDQAIAAGVVKGRRRRIERTARRPPPDSLERQYAMRRHYVDVGGAIRLADLAKAFEVSEAQARNVVRGQQMGKGRYDRLQDDGLQPEIDRLRGER